MAVSVCSVVPGCQTAGAEGPDACVPPGSGVQVRREASGTEGLCESLHCCVISFNVQLISIHTNIYWCG